MKNVKDVKEQDLGNKTSSLLEMTKYVGSGWKPVSVRTHRTREGVNVLKQEITLYYTKMDKPKGKSTIENRANLRVRVFSKDN